MTTPQPDERGELEQQAGAASERSHYAIWEGRYADAIRHAEEALVLLTNLHQHCTTGHPELARGMNHVGYVWYLLGQPEQALVYMGEALNMRRVLYSTDKYPHGHSEVATSLSNVGLAWRSLGQPARALEYMDEALAMSRRLYPTDKFPNGHPELARGLNNVGFVWQALSQPERELKYMDEALRMYRRLCPADKFPNGHPELATNLSNVALAWRALGRPECALEYAVEALAMQRRLHPMKECPVGHPSIAQSLNNLGFVFYDLGQPEEALVYLDEALFMYRRIFPNEQFPDGHSEVATSLSNVGLAWRSLGQPARALEYMDEALAMSRRLYPTDKFPNGHPELARGLNNVGFVWQALSQFERSLMYLDEALGMYRRLYSADKFPDGHSELAMSLSNVGDAWYTLGQFERALMYADEALGMYRRLYPAGTFPDGHPELAASLCSVGEVRSLCQLARALEYVDEALTMSRRLYPADKFPNGHPFLTKCLGAMGNVWSRLDKPERALSFAEEALHMSRRLFPNGHPDCATYLADLSQFNLDLGHETEGIAGLEEAIDHFFANLERASVSAHDADALDQLLVLKVLLDTLIAALCADPVGLSRAYIRVWKTRGYLFAILRHRHTAALAKRSARPIRELWDRLITTESQFARLFVTTDGDLSTRNNKLTELETDIDRLLREIVSHLPLAGAHHRIRDTSPMDLSAALSKDAVFVELVRYSRWESRKFAGDFYVAFVVAHGQEPIAVDLGCSEHIDAAITEWRSHIDRSNTSTAPHFLRQALWEPLERRFPLGVATVYIRPDGALWKLPFAALSGRGAGAVLLDHYCLAVVPSGPYLLEQLRAPNAPTTHANLLAVGGVDFGVSTAATSAYPQLDRTIHEVQYVCRAFNHPLDQVLGGSEALPGAVAVSLCSARYAHIATHGYFNRVGLSEERSRYTQFLNSGACGTHSRHVGIGLRNMLGYVGLALAGANRSESAGILTGLEIAALPLESLKLCVLSACDTGLGTQSSGEGLSGLQRAFHIAGCPNVIASLWKVDDAATAALMVKFYHEHLTQKQPVLDALRTAQLAIYRHPERIPALAGEHGEHELRRAIEATTDGTSTSQRAPTRLWAGFVLSGLGWWRESTPTQSPTTG